MRAYSIALFLLLPSLLSASPIPGIVRQTNTVYLMENHCHAWQVWHAQGITNATVVHLDTHDDCRFIPTNKINTLNTLTARKQFSEIFRLSDTASFLNLQVPDNNLLFDLGNYLYPCILDGTIRKLFWVVPDKTLDPATAERLQQHLQNALRIPNAAVTPVKTGGFNIQSGPINITVCTLDQLPVQPAGTLLDLDVDFFSFSSAMAPEHLTGPLQWDPLAVCRTLAEKLPTPYTVTVSASVWGGYLPLLLRHIADGCFDFFATGAYPEEALQLLQLTEQLRTRQPSTPLPRTITTSPVYAAAVDHATALQSVYAGNTENALTLIRTAAARNPVYRKGLLDLADALVAMGKFQEAHATIEEFEKMQGQATYNSLLTRTLIYLRENRPVDAAPIAKRLVEWSRTPLTLLTLAGVMEKQNELAPAISIYREIIATSPMHSEALYNLAVILTQQGKTDEAIQFYQQSIQARKNFWQAHENLGHLLLQNGKLKEADKHLRAALEINPTSLTSLNNLGLSLTRQDRPAEAIPFFEIALRMNKDHAALHFNLATALYAAGKHDEAGQHCLRVLELAPNTPAAEALLKKIRSKED